MIHRHFFFALECIVMNEIRRQPFLVIAPPPTSVLTEVYSRPASILQACIFYSNLRRHIFVSRWIPTGTIDCKNIILAQLKRGDNSQDKIANE